MNKPRRPAPATKATADIPKEKRLEMYRLQALLRQSEQRAYNLFLDRFIAGGDPGFTQGRDLKTGKVTATFPPQKAWGHHRCYRNKATVNWLMVGRGGVQFIEESQLWGGQKREGRERLIRCGCDPIQ